MTGNFWSKFLGTTTVSDTDFDPSIIFEGDSPFHHIIIREEDDRRTMYFGPCGEEAETSINPANPEEAVFEYPGMMLAALPGRERDFAESVERQHRHRGPHVEPKRRGHPLPAGAA